MKTLDISHLVKMIGKNKYILLVFFLGLLLLLLPRSVKAAPESGRSYAAASAGDPMEASGIPLDTECVRIAGLLSEMQGVGDAEVLLSREGAVIVCAGADSATVRLVVTNAVSAYTGLGSDKISVIKMK